MTICHAAGPVSIPGRDKFPGRGFCQGFSSPVRQMSGSFRAGVFNPRAACGPRATFVRPGKGISQNNYVMNIEA